MEFINDDIDLKELKESFRQGEPFNHIIIDDFLKPEVAAELVAEFPPFESDVWHEYLNPIEIKRTCNNWNVFPATTYRLFDFLCSSAFVRQLQIFSDEPLWSDPGLNGGGWHTHRRGGKLNTHLDYSIHPKLKLERKLNLIIYISPDWDPAWGGALGLWESKGCKCGSLSKTVDCIFNRAVIFDTTQNSWHGLPEPLTSPESRARNSLATYYCREAKESAPSRDKALFEPHGKQVGDEVILDLIAKRSSSATASTVYKKELD